MKVSIVSAPGKVLLTGGYLILDQNYSGLVIAVDSRFYVKVESSSNDADSLVHFIVKSPQFTNGNWSFAWSSNSNLVSCGANNEFIYAALKFVVKYLESKKHNWINNQSNVIQITIYADNDFYSQGSHLNANCNPLNEESLKRIPRFNPTGNTIEQVPKTGLGSSAAMLSALIGALLLHLGVVEVEKCDFTLYSKSLIEHLAQCNFFFESGAHCYAQGKVGSGFDISAALYGSQIYTRFDPQIIENLFTMEDQFASFVDKE
jgi:phosphomevalonate kinase